MYDRMTVADLQTILADYVPAGYTFLQALNQVNARYHQAGCYKNMAARVVFANGTETGLITLPRRYLSLLGIQAEHGAPLPTYGEFHEWKELSIGYVAPNEYSNIGIIDQGDGYCTTSDITTEGVLRWTISNVADVGKSIRLMGQGTVNSVADSVIFNSLGEEGITLTTANPTADTTQTFSSLAPPFGGVQIPDTMVGRSTLSVVVNGSATTLATYEPGETRPSYRRYKTGVADETILAFCKLRFLPYRDDTDWVTPCNVGAIKAGFLALHKEDSMNMVEASQMWAYGIRLLNLELKADRGAAKPAMPLFSRPELGSGPRSVF